MLKEEFWAQAIEIALGKKGSGDPSRQNWDVDILSLSFGFNYSSREIDVVLSKYLARKLVIAASSNEGLRKKMTYPAFRNGVIAINSADADGTTSGFNPPMKPDKELSVLGERVESTWIDNSMKYMTGTSVATPIAAGVVGLLLEIAMKYDEGRRLNGQTVTVDLETHVRRYDGIMALLRSMSEKKGEYSNVNPWKLFLEDDDLDSAGSQMRRILKQANVMPPDN